MSDHQRLMLVSAFPLLCLAVSCVVWLLKQTTFSRPLQILGYFLIFNLAIELSARTVVYYFKGANNLPLLHVYTVGEFLLLSFFYRSLLPTHFIFRKYFAAFLVMVSLLILLNTAFLQNIYIFNSYAKTLVQVIVIIYAILFFFQLPEASNFKTQEGWSLRLINSAVLIYYCGSLFIFMFSNIFIGNSLIYSSFWIFNALLNFLFHVLVLISLWRVAFRRPKLSF